MKCDGCGKESFECPQCDAEVPLSDYVDIFHVGLCLNCSTMVDRVCEDRKPYGVST